MRTLLVAAAVLLNGCATTPEGDDKDVAAAPPPAPAPVPLPERGRISDRDLQDYLADLPAPAAGGQDVRVPDAEKDYLPFIDVAYNTVAAADRFGLPLADHYTRIRIETLNPKATDVSGTASGKYTGKNKTDRNYRDESRGWLSRALGAKSVTRTLLAEFDIKEPDIQATEALFAASFSSSNAEGENWSTDQSLALYATPWFKVGSNTTLTAKMRMQLADQREGTATSASVLTALTTAANLIAPSSALITYFNAPAMTEASNYLDTSVSSLFGRSITEQSSGSLALKTWSPSPIFVVSAAMPDSKDIRKTKAAKKIGTWGVYLDKPIASMFTLAEQADENGLHMLPDFSAVSGADILAFKVAEELTIYDYIFSRLDLADRIAALNETGDAGLARIICTRIDRGLSETGFNTWDAAAGVWAAATSDQMSVIAQNVLLSEDTCPAMARWTMLGALSQTY